MVVYCKNHHYDSFHIQHCRSMGLVASLGKRSYRCNFLGPQVSCDICPLQFRSLSSMEVLAKDQWSGNDRSWCNTWRSSCKQTTFWGSRCSPCRQLQRSSHKTLVDLWIWGCRSEQELWFFFFARFSLINIIPGKTCTVLLNNRGVNGLVMFSRPGQRSDVFSGSTGTQAREEERWWD